MKIVIISGSMREGAQTLKVCSYLQGRLQEVDPAVEAEVINLNSLNLPLDIDQAKQAGSDSAKALEDLRKTLDSAGGFVVASPEWNGMASAGLINMFHHVDKTMAHKPALLVSVSAGRGGSFPIAELRLNGYKNARIAYMPDHLIVRGVKDIMNEKPEDNDPNSADFYEKQADYSLKLLLEYAKALDGVRSSGVVDHDNFGNGMS